MACAGNTSAKTRASDWRKSFVEPPVKTSKQIDADFHYINYTPENYVEMDKLPDSSIKTTHYRGGPPPGRSTYASGEPRPTLKQSPWWLEKAHLPSGRKAVALDQRPPWIKPGMKDENLHSAVFRERQVKHDGYRRAQEKATLSPEVRKRLARWQSLLQYDESYEERHGRLGMESPSLVDRLNWALDPEDKATVDEEAQPMTPRPPSAPSAPSPSARPPASARSASYEAGSPSLTPKPPKPPSTPAAMSTSAQSPPLVPPSSGSSLFLTEIADAVDDGRALEVERQRLLSVLSNTPPLVIAHSLLQRVQQPGADEAVRLLAALLPEGQFPSK